MSGFPELDELVRLVARAFYSDECVVVLEALLRYRIVKDEDLATALKLHAKQLRRVLSQLKEDQLVTCKTRGEKKEGTGERTHTHIFWYIDFRHFVHSIKYRLYLMQRMLDSEETREIDQWCYYCPNEMCQTKYNSLDASKLVGLDGAFHCEQCNFELLETEQAQRVSRIQDRRQAVMLSLRKIIEKLRETERIKLPADVVPKMPKVKVPEAKAGAAVHGPQAAGPPKTAIGSTFNFAGMPLSTNMEVVVDIEGLPGAGPSGPPRAAGGSTQQPQAVPSAAGEAAKAPPPWMASDPAAAHPPPVPSPDGRKQILPSAASRKRARAAAAGGPMSPPDGVPYSSTSSQPSPPFSQPSQPSPAASRPEPPPAAASPSSSAPAASSSAPAAAPADESKRQYYLEYYTTYIRQTMPDKFAQMQAAGEIARMAAAALAGGARGGPASPAASAASPAAPAVKQEAGVAPAEARRPRPGPTIVVKEEEAEAAAPSPSPPSAEPEAGEEEEGDEEPSFEEEAADGELEEEYVTVQGERKRVREVTDADREAMTTEEYTDYYNKCDSAYSHFMDQ